MLHAESFRAAVVWSTAIPLRIAHWPVSGEQAEAVVPVALRRLVPVAVRGTAVPGVVVPAAAAEHAVCSLDLRLTFIVPHPSGIIEQPAKSPSTPCEAAGEFGVRRESIRAALELRFARFAALEILLQGSEPGDVPGPRCPRQQYLVRQNRIAQKIHSVINAPWPRQRLNLQFQTLSQEASDVVLPDGKLVGIGVPQHKVIHKSNVFPAAQTGLNEMIQ